MYYVVDTHAFLWYLADSPNLSRKAWRIFDLCDKGQATIVLPAVVLMECIDVLDKKKLSLRFEDLLLKIHQASNFIFSEINWALVLEINKLKGFKDLHDRAIVATAKFFDAPLISKDKTIKTFYPKIIW